MSEMIDSLNTLIGKDDTIPTIPEYVFIQRYLPVLMSCKDDSWRFNRLWIDEVSKSPYLPVDLLDNSGSIIGQVPPLVTPYDTIGETGTRLFNNLDSDDIRAQLLFNRTLELYDIQATRNHDNVLKWRALAVKYGYSLNDVNSVNESEDRDLYEEWDE